MAAPNMRSTSFLVIVFISLALMANSLARPLDHVDRGYTPGEEQVSKLGRGFRGLGGRGAFGLLPYGGYGWQQGGPYGPGWANSPYGGYPYPYGPYPYPYPGYTPTGGGTTWPFTSISQGLSATHLGSDVDCKSGAGEFHPYCNPGFSMSSEPKRQNHGTSMESDDDDRDMRMMPKDGRSMPKNQDGDDDNNN